MVEKIKVYFSKMDRDRKIGIIILGILIITFIVGGIGTGIYNSRQQAHQEAQFQQVFAQAKELIKEEKLNEAKQLLTNYKAYSTEEKSNINSTLQDISYRLDSEKNYEEGLNQFNGGNYEKAISAFKSVDKNYINDKKYADAQEKLKVAIPKYVEETKSKVNDYVSKGNYKEAYNILCSANSLTSNQELANMTTQIQPKMQEQNASEQKAEAEKKAKAEAQKQAEATANTSTKINSSSSDTSNGKSITLSRGITVCSSRENVDKMISYVQNNNTSGEQQMLQRGEARNIYPGTKISIVKIGIVYEIADENGATWYTPKEVIEGQ